MPGFEFTRITMFQVLHWAGMILALAAGGTLGFRWFEAVGAIVGCVVGLIVGSLVGSIPDWVATKSLFKELEKSSDDELKEILAKDEWNFYQTMALLNLAARGEDPRSYLPRIGSMLQSDVQLERVYGWDALRLVFPPETEQIGDYDPKEPVRLCRVKVRRLDPEETADRETPEAPIP